jgi:hypothetical protein
MKMKSFYLLFLWLIGSTAFAQITFPVTFDNESLDYEVVAFEGAVSQIVVDPTDANNMVVETLKPNGVPPWAGTTVADITGFANPIPFSEGNTTMNLRVWSPVANIPVRLKVEQVGDPTVSVETEAFVTAANEWVTLVFDFSNEADGTAEINFSSTYNKASVFMDFGSEGNDLTYYFDDLDLGGVASPPPGLLLPVTFNDPELDYVLVDFGGTASEIVVDPTDAENMVVQTTRNAGETWAGTSIGENLSLAQPVPFAPGATQMTVRVWSPTANMPVRLKVENINDGAVSVEAETFTTVAEEWETLTFDFSTVSQGAPINFNVNYNKPSIFFNFGNVGAGEIYFWDDLDFVGGSNGGGANQVSLPVTFDDEDINYELQDFGGTASQIVVDPTDPNNMVVETVKNAGEFWAGTTVADVSGFAEPIPFAPGSTQMTVRVWSPTANIPVRLKVEDASNGDIFVETDAFTTVAEEWETLTFNMGVPVGPPINFSNTYNKASIFFDFGTVGSGQTYYWDDLDFVDEVTPPSGITFPITFNDEELDYELTDFGGAESEIVVDPTDAGNMVVQTLKTEGAAGWAGTTVGGVSGFSQPIPFDAENTIMTLRVWSPQANIPVMLKVEQLGDVTVYVEMEQIVPVANEWVTLTYDVTQEREGTAAVNFNSSYNMASVFFNMDVEGEGLTYFWDDLDFPGGTSSGGSGISLPITFDDESIDYELFDFDGTASVIVVDPTDSENMVVQTTKNDGAPWAGTSVAHTSGFSEPIPFAPGATQMTVRVWSPTADIPVRLKVENVNTPEVSVETQVNTTVAEAWETLTFDFSNQAPETAALSFENTYNKATIFFDFMTPGDGEIYFWDDLEFVDEVVTPPGSAISLPITFDDESIDYELFDFDGTASAIVVDPTDSENMVVQTTKNAGAPWAGTSVAHTSGFSEPIPFAPGATQMTVRVWSPTADIPVRLKVENVNTPEVSVETQVNTTVAEAWETLTFDFSNQAPETAALSFENTYNKATIFFDFMTPGDGEIYFWDDLEFVDEVVTPPGSAISLPITFDDESIDYELFDFDGTASAIVVDPTDSENMVVQTTKNAGAPWAGTSVAHTSGFSEPIPFAPGATQMTVRVWSPTADIPVRLKVENVNTPEISVETQVNTTVAEAWETLTFDFSNEAPETAALSFENTYNKATIFFDFMTPGDGEIYFWDDLEFVDEVVTPPAGGISLPITFEDTELDYELQDFGGTASEIIVDPTNPENRVVQTTKNEGEFWAGTTVADVSGLTEPIPFSEGNTIMSVRVWSPTANIPVRLKVENAADGGVFVETDAFTTVANEWETLTFDMALQVTGTPAINFANIYDKVSVFFDFGTVGSGQVYYWDDIDFEGGGVNPPPVEGLTLPVTFNDAEVEYGLTDFGGAASQIIVDPTDAGNMVVETIKTPGSETWAGTTVGGTVGFEEPVPFQLGAAQMTLRVWTPSAGTPVRLKVEDSSNGDIFVETETLTTVSEAWETLTFNFEMPAEGTPLINFDNNYNLASVLFNFGAAGAGETYYWDDLDFDSSVTPPAGLTLPVTFDDEDIDYGLIDFGGNASQIIVDPTDAENMVVETIKTPGSETWAGTTVGGVVGFEEPVPFQLGAAQMTLRVWAPSAGTPVRLKVEDATNGAIFVETEVLTTVGEEWETLSFNFETPAPGTPLINFSNTYNKASVFFNFDAVGAGETYYWDDLDFDSSVTPPSGLTLPITFEDEEINYGLIDFGGNASETLTDPTNPSNTVVRSIKTAGSETWAGTTVGGVIGLEEAVPFAPGASVMMARVWAPNAGTPIRLKIEDATNGGIFVESEVTTTVGGAWETLFFDMENAAPGTPAINFANTYDKISIFFNFGTAGTGESYFWDDIDFGVAVGVNELNAIKNSFNVYPNPTNGQVNIDFGTLNLSNAEISVMDISGKMVERFRVSNQITQIDLSHIKSGIYFITLMSNDGVITQKVIKQ